MPMWRLVYYAYSSVLYDGKFMYVILNFPRLQYRIAGVHVSISFVVYVPPTRWHPESSSGLH